MAGAGKKLSAIPRKVRIEPLEARVLYSAEAAPLLALVDPDANALLEHNIDNAGVWDGLSPNSSLDKITELVLVDNTQPDIQSLLALISSSQTNNDHIAIVSLDSDLSAMDSISQTLKQFDDLHAIHIVSHASDGALKIDNEIITLATLHNNLHAVEQWGESLNNDGDILLYGCNLSATPQGHAFAKTLSDITNADVASSNDITGHALKNGNWDLEVTEGVIETDSAITQAVQNDWTGSLDITSGLVHHYEFQNNGADSVGSAPATLFNDVSFDQGQVRLAAQFDADPVGLQYAEINSADLTNFGTDYFSVAMWVKTTDTGDENVLMSNMDTSTNGFRIFTDDSGEINIEYVDGSTRNINSSISIADGNWYHVVATRGFEGMYLRITDANGVLVDDEFNTSDTVATLNVDSSDNLRIGSDPADSAMDYDGEIDDIRFYDRDLNLAEIAEIAAEGTAPQQQSILNNNEVTLDNNTTKIITSDDLLTVDKESNSGDLTYELTSNLADGLELTLNNTPLSLGDNFTQADVDAGLIEITADTTPTSSLAQTRDYTFDFEVSDPNGPASADVFQISVNEEANTPPTIDSVTLPQTISEATAAYNAATAAYTIVGSVSVSDIDGDTISISVAAPGDEYFGDEYFSVDASNNIVLIKTIDYETHNSIDLTITASDAYGETSQTTTIDIGDENDAPYSGEGIVPYIDEDTVNPPGLTVEDLFFGAFFDDDAGDTIAGMAIREDYTNSNSEGQYEYSTDGVNWQAIGNVSYNNALLLSASTYIRFDPTNNFYGPPDNAWINVISTNDELTYSTNAAKTYFDINNAAPFGYVDPIGNLLETKVLPVNDSPQVPAAWLPSIQEDSGNSIGATITSIYESIFSDTDANTNNFFYNDYYVSGDTTGDKLAGLVITRNKIDADQGNWEYSTDNINWHAIGTVSTEEALVLSASSSIRFVPANDFAGTPNNLSIRALDNSWSGGFTDGTTRVVANTDSRPSDSPMSSGNPPLKIEVTNVNDAPVANDDVLTVDEGGSVSIDLFANDTDAENDTLSFQAIGSPSNGYLSFQDGGNITYQHDGSESTTDTFTYTVTDGTDSSNQATVTINITPVNDAPNAVDDNFNATEDTDLIGDVTSNDSDAEDDPITAALISTTSNGSLLFNSDGSFTYTHNQGSENTDSFTYQLSDGNLGSNVATASISITTSNDAPTINSINSIQDFSESTAAGTIIATVDVTDNENDDVALSIQSPEDAYLTIDDSNNIRVVSAVDHETQSSITFNILADDGNGGTDTKSFTLPIIDVNEAPTIASAVLTSVNEDDLNPPGELISTLFGGSFSDVDDNASLIGVAIDSNAGGTTNGVWEYKTEEPTWHQVFSPTQSGALVLHADDVVRFLPAENYNGTPTPLTLHALDDGYTGNFTDGSNRVLLDVASPEEFGPVSLAGVDLNATITPVNDTPVAVDDNFNATEDTDLIGNVIDNDSDAENDPITAALIDTTSNGSLTFNNNGSFTYTHNQGPASTDSFTYQLSDGSLDSNVATASINITTSNDAPTINSINSIQDFSESTAADTIIATVNVTDTENDDVVLSIQSPEDAHLTIDDANNIRVVSAVDHETQSSITFNILADDGNGGTDTKSFTLPIIDVNEAPTITSAILTSVSEDDLNPPGELISSLFGGSFSDVDDNASFAGIAIDSNPASNLEGAWQYSSDNGTQWHDIANRTTASALLLSESTLIRFLPAANFNGAPTALTLHAIDNDYTGTFTNDASEVTLSTDNLNVFGFLSVDGVQLETEVLSTNDAPIATTDNYNLNEGQSVTGNVLANDSDVEGNSLTATLLTAPQHGSLSLLDDGAFTYTHSGDDSTTDRFTYQVSDGSSTSVGEANFNISGVNDAPAFDFVTLNPSISELDNAGLVVGSIDVSDEENDTITISLDTPSNSYFTLNASGKITLSTAIDYETLTAVPINIIATDSNNASSTYRANVPIQDINEAPTIESVTLNTINEDDNDPIGETVSALFIDSFLDVDAGAALSGIAITDNTITSDGDWQYSIDGANWINIGTVSDTNALVIAQNNSIRFLADADFNGTPPPLSVRALDNEFSDGFTDGNSTVYTDVSNAQAFGSVSIVDEQISTAVAAENDPPVAVDDDFNTAEDAELTGTVITNDYDTDGDSIQASLESTTSNGTLTFSSNGSFTYVHNQGTTTTDSFTYQLSDGVSNSDIATVNIGIAIENDAPTIDSVPLRPEINESLVIGTIMGSINATDVDGDTLTFSIDSPADSFLAINESNQIVTIADLDHETQPSLSFVITASDGNGGEDTANVTFNIDNVNEAPSISDASLTSINEDDTKPNGASITALFSDSFIDADDDAQFAGIAVTGNPTSANGQWQYSIDGTSWNDIGTVSPDSALVLAATHEVRFLPSANYHGTPDPLSIRALDNHFEGNFSDAANAEFTDVTSANYFGAISISDAELDTNVVNINDSPMFSSVDIANSISEFAAVGTVVGTVSTSDIDGDVITLSMESPADEYLSINTANEIVLNSAVDHEALASIPVAIKATDGNGGVSSYSGSIQIDNEYENPTIASAALANIDEDNQNPAGETLLSLFSASFADEDNSAELSGIAISGNSANGEVEGEWQYSNDGLIWSGIGSTSPTAALVIESSSLVRFLPSENYHGVPGALSIYALDDNYADEFSDALSAYIDVSDSEFSGTIALQAVTLSTEVVSINDIPFLTSPLSSFSIPENTAAGTIVGVVQASDSDHTALSYSLVDDADGKFDFDESTRTISVAENAQLDFETVDAYTITLRVMDQENGFSDTDVTILVTPKNEPPRLDAIESERLEFVENDSAKAISTTITVAEPDNGLIESAVISFLSGFHPDQDQLVFQDSANISGQFDSSEGILTLSGSDQATAYQEAIRSVSYLNTSENPSASSRVISVVVNDDANASNVLNREISVASVNDEGSLTANEGASIEPNGSFFISSEMLNVTDVDNESNSIVYSKADAWPSILLLVNGELAETFTQQDINLGMVEIMSTDSSAERIVLPMFVNDGVGQPLTFEMIISVNQVEVETETETPAEPEPLQPLAALEAAPIDLILGEILNEIALPKPIQTSSTSDVQTENLPSESNEAQAVVSSVTQVPSSVATEQSVFITIPEQFKKVEALDLAVLASELSEPETVAKSTKPLSAKAAVDLQLASLLSLEPLTLEYSNDFKLQQSENLFIRSMQNMQEQIARTAEKYQNNTTLQDSIAGVTISITAGFLIWAIRGGALLASMLSISPLWKQLDPLAIMNSIKGDKPDVENNDDDEEVEDLFTKS